MKNGGRKKLFQRRKKSFLKCFDKESRKQNLLYQVDKGIKMVKISKIVGSVGRCVDFNIDFKPQRENMQERLDSAKSALKLGISLPPIELYKVKDEYYVVDGHHRVAAAKELRKKYFEAHIIEYLPPKDSLENTLYYAKLDFEYETGLERVNFSRPAEYKKAISQIRNHYLYLKSNKDKKITFKEAAYHWFCNIYQPLTRTIEKEKVVNQFKNVTSGDIYLYISDQLQLRNRKRDYYISLSEALKEAYLLREETRLLTSPENFKEKIKKILFPCYYLKRCPYLRRLGGRGKYLFKV